MGFVPRLPTWNTTFTPYKHDNDTGITVTGANFNGQLYTLQRMAEVTGEETMFAMYPKEVDFLVDSSQLPNNEWHAVKHTWQGEDWYWYVTQCMPRWANFPNEHRMMLLTRVRPVDKQKILDGLLVTDPDQSTVFFAEDTVLANGTDIAHFHIVLRNGNGDPIPNRNVAPNNVSSATALFTPANMDTDSNGEAIFEFTNDVEEMVTSGGYDNAGGVPLTDTDTVIFDSGLEWEVSISGTADDTCTDCASLDGIFPCYVQGTDFWAADEFSWSCAAGGMAGCAINKSGDDIFVSVYDASVPITMATWYADISGWNQVDPITCDLQSDDGSCDFPLQITLSPA